MITPTETAKFMSPVPVEYTPVGWERIQPMTTLETIPDVEKYIQNRTSAFGPYLGCVGEWLYATTASVNGRDEFRFPVIHESIYWALPPSAQQAIEHEVRIRFCIWGLKKIQKMNEEGVKT